MTMRLVPADAKQLFDNLKKLYDNKGHVKKVEVDTKDNRIEVTLDWLANRAGAEDFYIPLKKANVADAQKLVDAMWAAMKDKKSTAPTEAQAKELFGYIDPNGK